MPEFKLNDDADKAVTDWLKVMRDNFFKMEVKPQLEIDTIEPDIDGEIIIYLKLRK